MAKIITLGEIMLRLSPKNHQRIIQSQSFDVHYGGGEANVAVSLAQFGHKAYFVSKIPNNEIGQAAINHLSRYGVHTEYIVQGGHRLGIYFLENGASMRPSKVIYDRSNSAISEATIEDFNFDIIFKDADWFHFTGITPALSENAKKVIEYACKKAKKNGITISVDLNFRKKLWTQEEARKTMKPLMKYVDICIGNEEDAYNALGYKPKNTDVEKGHLDIASYKDILENMQKDFNFKYIISTLRTSISASDNQWSALIYDGKEFYQSRQYDIRIVDRVGGGDSFAAGYISQYLKTNNFKESLEFATAASALKHTIHGDFNLIKEDEVKTLLDGNISGRVER